MFQIDIFNYLNKKSTNFKNLLFLISKKFFPSSCTNQKKKERI